MGKIYLALLALGSVLCSFGQEEDESCLAPPKKVLKLIQAGQNAGTPQLAAEKFSEAMKEAPDNAMAYYEFGMYAYNQGLSFYERQIPNQAAGDRSFKKAEALLKEALSHCSDYHANCSYYLGVINYNQNEVDEAISYFKQFLNYNHSDMGRYSEDHDKKLQDVQAVIKQLESDQQLKTKEVPFSPVMVKNVCTADGEYFPMISPDNELMFYTRKLDRRNLGDMVSNVVEEFTFSERTDMDAEFDRGKPFKKPFNDGSFASYGAATMSVDNKEMIICACKNEPVSGRDYMNCDLYITEFKRSGTGGNDFEWTPLENMGPGINTKTGWEAQPTLSADGNTLFYTALRPDTQMEDIYMATRDADGAWSEGRPVDVLNTEGKDKSPFLHQDSETLYFVSSSSDKRKGIGGLDIFISRMKNGSWDTPVNIGYPINSKADEIGVFVSTNGKLAYFSSRVGGDWNIYQFELYPEARPKPVAMIKGDLKGDDGKPVSDATIEVAYEDGKVEKVKVNGDDGKYAAIVKLDKPQDVMVSVKKEGHAFDSKLVTKEDLTAKTVVRGKKMDVKPLKEGEAYTINDILFETSSYSLTKKSKFILQQFARFLQENESITIMIQGHTDDVGNDAENMKLSENRAQSVKKYLIELGVEGKRLSAKGFGETRPKVPNKDYNSRAINRRTDFMIQKL
ncbi:MAG: hypothetical protein EP338_12185 [Bacteroidetes bacterium]|nr:MAG: hypothetical protein EP338_12185 [Bacteroidota bacterium]